MVRTFAQLAVAMVASQFLFAFDSPKDLLSAGKVDTAIASLNTKVASNANDAEAHELAMQGLLGVRRLGPSRNQLRKGCPIGQ